MMRFHCLLFAWLAGGLPVAPLVAAAEAPPSVAASHWAFQPVVRPAVPAVREGSWARTDIDRFILAAWEQRRQHPAPPADRLTALRRVTYDLTGLPPTPTEVDDFLADSSPGAWSRVVERLLASPRHGERWGRHWLDVVRYADTAGENSDHPLPHAWRYRNWVIQAINNDLPYDEFIRRQIAGDLLPAPETGDAHAEGVIATGYLAIARRFGHDIDKDMHLTIEDTIDTLGKSVLGLTLGCARCHDHKNDPVSARDYYGLYGIFQSTRYAFPGCEPQQQPRDLVPLWTPAEVALRRKPFERELAGVNAAIKSIETSRAGVLATLLSKATNAARILARGQFNDGGAQSMASNAAPLEVTVHPGEMLRLTIYPRANYGADTTVLEWRISEAAGGRTWDLAADVTGDFLAGNPHADRLGHAATWCFLDARQGLELLPEPVRDHEGRPGLHIWRRGENPAVFVNATDQPIKAWTSLPARTVFAHPAPDGPVAVAWLSPVSGKVRITGRVADGHAGGGDGVAWTLEHLSVDLGAGMAELASSAGRLREPLRRRAELLAREPRVPVAYAVTEGRAANARLHKRGDPEQPGPEVPRKFPDILGGQFVTVTNQSGRLELAAWLTSPTNPLTARVMVNRIWQGHFGRGLVGTPNDFGRMGQRPLDPALLDWLADEFVRSGWSMKTMHRLIVNSAVYQQDSVGGAGSPETWSPFPRRRLSAEEVRDTLLLVSGDLDSTPGSAHPFPPESTWNFTQHGPFAANYDTLKRSVYVMQKRNRRLPFFALFDGADPNASTARRDVTTVPTQALYFLNDPFVHARAARLAERARAAAGSDAARVDFLHRELYGRVADAAEQVLAQEFLQACRVAGPSRAALDTPGAWSAYVRVLLGANEFLHVD